MRKVKVNYPKKRTRLHLEDLGNPAEPDRKSMYQVLQENLKGFNRATFLHRIIYVGEHKLESFDQATELFYGIIKQCNETYCIEKLSGFLLYYNRYFVHMTEGDEDNLNKHLNFLLDKSAKHYHKMGSMKLLISVANINQRFMDNWIAFTESPSKLLEKFDINADLATSVRCIYNCIKKFYSLVSAYVEDSIEMAEAPQERLKSNVDTGSSTATGEGSVLKMYSSFSYNSNSDSAERSAYTDINQRDYKFFLPEYELLDFVIKSSFTIPVQEYYDLYGVVPMRDIYKDKVWPVPHDFIPYDVFEKPYDCMTELPKDFRRRKQLEGSPGPSAANSLASIMAGTSVDMEETPVFKAEPSISISPETERPSE